MPELPEVETIRRGLSEFIISQKIVDAEVRCEKSFIGPKEVVLGQIVESIDRKGKALLINLSNGVTLMVHLRMTGQLVYRDKEVQFAGGHPTDSFFKELPDKQTRVIFTLEKGVLYFNDQRKFGFVKVLPTDEVGADSFIAGLGPEPWEMRAEDLYTIFQRRKGSPVKGVILDQKVVAGIGNIYADEALFYAGIHPATLCGELTLNDAEQILVGAREVMQASIDSGGSTMATYVRADGTKGNYLEKFAKVFRREGEPCVKCGCEIKKIRVVGRGTHICPHCQKIVKGGVR